MDADVKRVLDFLHRDRRTVVKPAVPVARDIGVLGLDTRVRGDVRFQGMLTVDGTIAGHIRAPEGSGAVLVVGENATVTGDIVSDSVLISGRITGSVKARERVEIFGTGVLHGDIETGDIMIQGGAEFQGRCQMLKPAAAMRAELEVGPKGAPNETGSAPSPSADASRRGRRQGAAGADRSDTQPNREDGERAAAGEPPAVHKDSRTERGSSTEGTSA